MEPYGSPTDSAHTGLPTARIAAMPNVERVDAIEVSAVRARVSAVMPSISCQGAVTTGVPYARKVAIYSPIRAVTAAPCSEEQADGCCRPPVRGDCPRDLGAVQPDSRSVAACGPVTAAHSTRLSLIYASKFP